MITVNSLSGGKSSSYIAKEFPADYNIFSLVRVIDPNLLYPDAKLRQMVSDRIGQEFIGTVEMDDVIPIIFSLEQYIGKEIKWLTGVTFEELIKIKANYLPNVMTRYCTSELKMTPIFNWWRETINEVCEMRIGFRYGEEERKNNLLAKLNSNGIEEYKTIIGKAKTRNKWGMVEWRKPSFPLIDNMIRKDMVDSYWKGKPVPFRDGYYNNCVGCFHRNPLFLSMMNKDNKIKMDWFERQEEITGNRFKREITYKQINAWKPYAELMFSDFTDCDSGYCGL